MAESYCLPCIYYGKTTNTCDYILIEDRCRPCPGGKGCTARRTKRMVKQEMDKPKWDTERGMQMWLEGKSDKEIAEHFGIHHSTVSRIRRKYWEAHKQPPKKMWRKRKKLRNLPLLWSKSRSPCRSVWLPRMVFTGF